MASLILLESINCTDTFVHILTFHYFQKFCGTVSDEELLFTPGLLTNQKLDKNSERLYANLIIAPVFCRPKT